MVITLHLHVIIVYPTLARMVRLARTNGMASSVSAPMVSPDTDVRFQSVIGTHASTVERALLMQSDTIVNVLIVSLAPAVTPPYLDVPIAPGRFAVLAKKETIVNTQRTLVDVLVNFVMVRALA